jgi:hypothetical protein
VIEARLASLLAPRRVVAFDFLGYSSLYFSHLWDICGTPL